MVAQWTPANACASTVFKIWKEQNKLGFIRTNKTEVATKSARRVSTERLPAADSVAVWRESFWKVLPVESFHWKPDGLLTTGERQFAQFGKQGSFLFGFLFKTLVRLITRSSQTEINGLNRSENPIDIREFLQRRARFEGLREEHSPGTSASKQYTLIYTAVFACRCL